MKAGNLVKVINPRDTMHDLGTKPLHPAFGNVGKTGIMLSKYDHRTATCGRDWFTVLVDGTPLQFREDYLEVLS